jgi:chromate transporter
VTTLILFLLFLKASVLSFGGLGGLPILHQDLAERPDLLPPGGSVDELIGESLAVGRVSPGPNGLFVVSLGYELDGIAGGIAGGVALALPPFVVLAIVAGYTRVAHLKRTSNALLMLSVALSGLLGFTSWQIMIGSSRDDLWEWAAGIVGFIVSVRFRVNPLLLIAGAGVVGIVIYR